MNDVMMCAGPAPPLSPRLGSSGTGGCPQDPAPPWVPSRQPEEPFLPSLGVEVQRGFPPQASSSHSPQPVLNRDPRASWSTSSQRDSRKENFPVPWSGRLATDSLHPASPTPGHLPPSLLSISVNQRTLGTPREQDLSFGVCPARFTSHNVLKVPSCYSTTSFLVKAEQYSLVWTDHVYTFRCRWTRGMPPPFSSRVFHSRCTTFHCHRQGTRGPASLRPRPHLSFPFY